MKTQTNPAAHVETLRPAMNAEELLAKLDRNGWLRAGPWGRDAECTILADLATAGVLRAEDVKGTSVTYVRFDAPPFEA